MGVGEEIKLQGCSLGYWAMVVPSTVRRPGEGGMRDQCEVIFHHSVFRVPRDARGFGFEVLDPDSVSPGMVLGTVYKVAQGQVRQTEDQGQDLEAHRPLRERYEEMQQTEKQEEHQKRVVAWSHGEGRSQEAQAISGRIQVVWGLGYARGFRNREAAGGVGQSSLPGTGVEVRPQCKG